MAARAGKNGESTGATSVCSKHFRACANDSLTRPSNYPAASNICCDRRALMTNPNLLILYEATEASRRSSRKKSGASSNIRQTGNRGDHRPTRNFTCRSALADRM